jgi:hypothetical protein
MVRLEHEDCSILVLRFHQPYGDADEVDYLAALEEIAREPGSFALLTIFGGGGGLSAAGEREQALWFKRNRALMDERCRALAIVRPGAGEEMAQVFRRLWRFPVTATPDEAIARRFLAEHVGALP